jgi:hypothetical protein
MFVRQRRGAGWCAGGSRVGQANGAVDGWAEDSAVEVAAAQSTVSEAGEDEVVVVVVEVVSEQGDQER